MRLLITGGCGFIGSNFVRYILTNRPDWQIINVDALTYAGNLANLQGVDADPRYAFVQGSVADKRLMREVFETHKPEGLIHFAAETHVDRSISDSTPFVEANIVGTHTLLELAREYEIGRYHQVSTDEVYGDLGDTVGTYFTEDTPLAPNCPYAATKAAADLLVLSWYETYGLNAVITRCSNNYGPYQYPEKLIPFMFKKAVAGNDLTLYGDGKNVRDWLYVEDHCSAILTVFEQSKPGETWNIGGHNEKTNIDICELILAHTPNTGSGISFISDRAAHDRRYAIDASKIERELGWRPAYTFDQALPMTLDWYAANPDWVRDCVEKDRTKWFSGG